MKPGFFRSTAHDIFRKVTLQVILVEIKLNLLPLLQAFEPLRQNGGIVNEYGISILDLNQPESLGIIEPDHLPIMHRSLTPPLFSF
jgi:hypothetical protein